MKRLILGTEDTEVLAPYEYPAFVKDKDDMHANHWRPQEIGCTEDIRDMKMKLTEDERNLYVTQFAWLTFMDINILELLSMMKLVSTAPEFGAWIGMQIGQEQNHSDAYQYLAEQLGLDQRDIYTRYQTVPSLAGKAALTQKYTGLVRAFLVKWLTKPGEIGKDDIRDLLRGLCFYGNGYEGVWFTGGFAPIYALTERGMMLSTSKQLTYIWRDENLHVEGWVRAMHIIQRETDVWLNYADVHRILSEVLEAEEVFARECVPRIVGYNPEIHVRWMRHLANLRMANMGFSSPNAPAAFQNAEPPLWIGKYQTQNEGNFFETRVVAYQTGGTLDGSWGDTADMDNLWAPHV